MVLRCWVSAAILSDAATVVSVDAGIAQNEVNFTLSRVSMTAMRNAGARLPEQATLREMRHHASARRGTWSSVDQMHRYFEATFIATTGHGVGTDVRRTYAARSAAAPAAVHGGGRFGAWPPHMDSETAGSHRRREARRPRRILANGTRRLAKADRRLTEFELQSLSTLRLGSNVVAHVENGEMLLVGAIRARSTCLACHQGHLASNTPTVGNASAGRGFWQLDVWVLD